MPESIYEFQDWFSDPDVQRELRSVQSLTGCTTIEACTVLLIGSLTAAIYPDDEDGDE